MTDLTHVLKLAGYHASLLMLHPAGDMPFVAAAHPDMLSVSVQIDPAPREYRRGPHTPISVWDHCTVTQGGRELYQGNRAGARDAYMAAVAAALTPPDCPRCADVSDTWLRTVLDDPDEDDRDGPAMLRRQGC